MLLAVACFAGMSAFVKVLREAGMSTTETMVYRMAPGLPWLWLELRLRGISLQPRRPTLVALRTALGGAAMGSSFFAVRGLTLLQHTVLHLAQPVFVAGLSPFLLRERLRGAALLALLLALGGAMVAIRVDQVFGAMAEVPLLYGAVGLAAAVFSALAHMVIRRATGETPTEPDATPESPEALVFYFTLGVSVAGLLIGVPAGDFQTLPASLSGARAVLAIGGMAALGALGQLLMSRAYARAPAPLVATVAYAAIPLSIAIDVVVWGSPASFSALVGAGLMVAAGGLLLRHR